MCRLESVLAEGVRVGDEVLVEGSGGRFVEVSFVDASGSEVSVGLGNGKLLSFERGELIPVFRQPQAVVKTS